MKKPSRPKIRVRVVQFAGCRFRVPVYEACLLAEADCQRTIERFDTLHPTPEGQER